jgi:ketosteroid isomerase-like protein
VTFEVLEVELAGDLGFIRTRSTGTIAPKGQAPAGPERNRELFIVKKIDGAWKIYRYISNLDVATSG